MMCAMYVFVKPKAEIEELDSLRSHEIEFPFLLWDISYDKLIFYFDHKSQQILAKSDLVSLLFSQSRLS